MRRLALAAALFALAAAGPAFAAGKSKVRKVVEAAGLMGWLRRECAWWERALLIAAALLLIKPGYITDAIGLVLLGIVVAGQWRARPVPGVAPPTPGVTPPTPPRR